MIKSQYINDILDLITDGDTQSPNLKQQIKSLSENKTEFTDIGVFIYFDHASNILNYKLSNDSVLSGVKIEIKEFDISAEANLFIQDGIINNLEIFCINGLYPKIEPLHYKLIQVWEESPGRIIER